ncbi:MAG: hypothetical protein RMY62_030955 [Nostoc sp. ZfuVER08]|nr:hypothetical protein [Nostoc sp. ZfuVER08]
MNSLPEFSFSRFSKIQVLTKQPAEGKILSITTHTECGINGFNSTFELKKGVRGDRGLSRRKKLDLFCDNGITGYYFLAIAKLFGLLTFFYGRFCGM